MLPNLWLRLARTGNTLTSYYGSDGTTGARIPPTPATICLSCSWSVPSSPATTTPSWPRASSATSTCPPPCRSNIVVTAPTVAACSGTADFTVAADNPANSGLLWYQWKKNGVNIAGANCCHPDHRLWALTRPPSARPTLYWSATTAAACSARPPMPASWPWPTLFRPPPASSSSIAPITARRP